MRSRRFAERARVLLAAGLLAATVAAAEDEHRFSYHSADIGSCRWWNGAVEDCLTARGNGVLVTGSEYLPARDGRADERGLRRDTNYFLGMQFAVIGVLFVAPEGMSGWSEEQKEQHRFGKWWDNVTGPKWDEDDHVINYVTHPYWGAAYYVRARERGYDDRQSFWYSFMLSTMYEFGAEALFEPVSIQDFFVTPIVGTWLGRQFMDWRAQTEDRIERTGERRFRDRVVLGGTDPLGAASRLVDRMLCRGGELQALPFVREQPLVMPVAGGADVSTATTTVYGVSIELRW